MANQTPNLNLTKPTENEYYDINIQNENLDKIDVAVQNAGKVKSVNSKIGDVILNAADVGALPITGGNLANNLTIQGKQVVHAGNIATYAPPVENYDGRLGIGVLVGPGRQFSTIQAAVNSLKKVSAGNRSILVDPEVYLESVHIYGFHGGQINILCSDNNRKFSLNDIKVEDCTTKIGLYRIQVLESYFSVYGCLKVNIEDCIKSNTKANMGLYADKSNVALTNCAFSNCISGAVTAINSYVTVERLSGTNNSIAFNSAYASVIVKYANSISATTIDSRSGGQIFG